MKIKQSEWPAIAAPADVEPAWQQLRTLRDRYAGLVEAYEEAKKAAPKYRPPEVTQPGPNHRSDNDDGPNIGKAAAAFMADLVSMTYPWGLADVLELLDSLIELPDQVDVVREPVTAADFGRPPRTPRRTNEIDWRPIAAFWANRRGLEALRAGRNDGTKQRSATRGAVRQLAGHVNGPLYTALTAEMIFAGTYFDACVLSVEQQFAAAERGGWISNQQLPEPVVDDPEPEPQRVIAATLRNPL